MEKYTLEDRWAEVDLVQYRESCVDVDKFQALCAQCPNYGARWACPPYGFDPETLWSRYDRLNLRARVLTPQLGVDPEEIMGALRREREAFFAELLALEAQTPGSFALSPGGCTLCTHCTREEGIPCRLPQKLRYSIESLGGDVGKTTQRWLGLPLVWAPAGEVAPYYCMVGGLLIKNEAE